MFKQQIFSKIAREIKEVKIQGARNIAKAALHAYSLIPTKESKKKLISLRETEPMLEKVINLAEDFPASEIKKHFDYSQNEINEVVFKLIKNDDIILTHCHSTNVINALIYAKRKGKRFQVYNTETRPLYQGRKTAKELKNAKIKVTMFTDSAIGIALAGKQGVKKADKIFLGADALLKNGIVNKVGSGVISQLAEINKTPVYIIADSWKFTKKHVPLEQRELNEIWDNAPKDIKIKNPAFEFVDKKYIKKIITEFGILGYDRFVKKVG